MEQLKTLPLGSFLEFELSIKKQPIETSTKQGVLRDTKGTITQKDRHREEMMRFLAL